MREFEGKMKKKKEVSRPKQRDERWKLGGVGGAQIKKKNQTFTFIFLFKTLRAGPLKMK